MDIIGKNRCRVIFQDIDNSAGGQQLFRWAIHKRTHTDLPIIAFPYYDPLTSYQPCILPLGV